MIQEAAKIDYSRFKKVSINPEKKPVTENVAFKFESTKDNLDLLFKCEQYWNSLSEFRRKRRRCRDYHEGKQWSDKIYSSVDRRWMTEEEYIKNQGRIPLKQNRIREKVKNLVGQWRTNDVESMVFARAKENTEASEMMSSALQYVLQFNRTDELDAREFTEFALSGMAIWRSCFRWMKERNMSDVFTETPNSTRVFFNTDIEDFRMSDLRLIGQIIDASPNDILAGFAKNSIEEQQIKDIYKGWSDQGVNNKGMSSSNYDSLSFLYSGIGEKWRLIEVWELKSVWRMYVWDPIIGREDIYDYTEEQIQAMNRERYKFAIENGVDPSTIGEKVLLKYERKLEQIWYYKFLTPSGYCLAEGESNYEHQEHPFTVLLDPLIDGEIWGFVYDFLDQQRYINRLTILMDWIIQSSAKGVLMIHKKALGDNSPDDFAKKWAQFDGVVVYEGDASTPIPQQVSANSTNIGIADMIAMQMNYMDGVSGIHPAQQGAQASSGTPASRYAMEAQNATLNTVDMMRKFLDAKQSRDLKLIKLIKQFYKEERYLAIEGRNKIKTYDPEKIKNIDFEYRVTQGVNTAVFRQAAEDILTQLRQEQLIDVKTYLENSTMPFAEKLLDTINKNEQKQLPPEVLQQLQAGTSLEKQQMIGSALGIPV